MEDKEEKKEDEVQQPMEIIIPQCCREGWASCPHVLRSQRKEKTNVGL